MWRYSGCVLNLEIPDDHKIILTESYRLPAVFMRGKTGSVKSPEGKKRLGAQTGRREVRAPPARRLQVARVRGLLKAIMQHLEHGQTVMLLASWPEVAPA